jgi:hypothetical protein
MSEKHPGRCTIARPTTCAEHRGGDGPRGSSYLCKHAAAADRAAAKRGGPAYPWRLYSDPKAGQPKARPTGSLRMPRWAHVDPLTAYKRILAQKPNAAETSLYADRLREWQDGTHPWAGASRPGPGVDPPDEDGPWPSYNEVTA